MRTLLFTIITTFLAWPAKAQPLVADSVTQRRQAINQAGLTILGSWAVLNVASGLVAQHHTSGEQKQFFRANAMWGGVNLLLAGVGYMHAKRQRTLSLQGTFQQQRDTEKLFLVNTALDLGYMILGLYSRERAARFSGPKKDRLLGTGSSFLLQGSFLFFFDGIMYLLHAKNGTRLDKVLTSLSFSPAAGGLGLIARF